MSDQGTDQPDEGREAVESLDFTAEELLEEIAGLMEVYPIKQPGDVTAKDLAARLGLSERQASTKLEEIARKHPDRYERVKVRAEYHWLWVLRRKCQ